MITVVEFSIISLVATIPIIYSLNKLHKSNKSIPIIGNFLFDLILMFFIAGFYGIIFKGGKLIEQLNLERSEDLQFAALFFALLYGIAFISFRPRV